MAEKRIKVSLIGKTDLLTNNPASMGKSASGPKGEKQIPTPEVEAAIKAYQVNGQYVFPGIGVRNSYVGAAGAWKVKLPGSTRKISARSVLACTRVEPELIPILDAKTGKPIAKYEIDTRRAVVQRINGVLRSRPKFKNWRLDCEIVFDDANLSEETVQQLFGILGDAGSRIGIGDYRPAKSGWFGTFEVKG